MTRSSAINRFTTYALLIAGAVLFAFPLVWMIATSLKSPEQAAAFPPTFLPRAHYAEVAGQRVEVTLDRALADRPGWWQVTTKDGTGTRAALPREQIETRVEPRWGNYPEALARMGGGRVGFGTFLGNTLIVCVLGVTGAVFSNAIVAYGFARLKWRGRDAFFAVTLATMMVPMPVLMVPLYGVFRELGWIGTLLPLWVPAWFGSAFNIFLMRQFFRTIPEEMSEAARIDGAGEWTIFWRLILPLSKPVLAVTALFHFLFAWNDFLGPLLYLTRQETFTLAIALQNYQSQAGGVEWPLLMAASAVVVAPVIVLFFLAQKTFIQGVATTGSKG
ncbi:MAG: carbohydrate ABC transporter permease [Verrucomicrobiota bacterium]